jgi:hypothetical protein
MSPDPSSPIRVFLRRQARSSALLQSPEQETGSGLEPAGCSRRAPNGVPSRIPCLADFPSRGGPFGQPLDGEVSDRGSPCGAGSGRRLSPTGLPGACRRAQPEASVLLAVDQLFGEGPALRVRTRIRRSARRARGQEASGRGAGRRVEQGRVRRDVPAVGALTRRVSQLRFRTVVPRVGVSRKHIPSLAQRPLQRGGPLEVGEH